MDVFEVTVSDILDIMPDTVDFSRCDDFQSRAELYGRLYIELEQSAIRHGIYDRPEFGLVMDAIMRTIGAAREVVTKVHVPELLKEAIQRRIEEGLNDPSWHHLK